MVGFPCGADSSGGYTILTGLGRVESRPGMMTNLINNIDMVGYRYGIRPRRASLSLLVALLLPVFTYLKAQEVITLESGLGIVELAEGHGDAAREGDVVVIHFKAWLGDDGKPGKMIANSEDHDESLSFVLGTAQVLPAWNEGVTGMKAGGKRRLIVLHELGVGAVGEGQLVPVDTDVIFEIELLEIREKIGD